MKDTTKEEKKRLLLRLLVKGDYDVEEEAEAESIFDTRRTDEVDLPILGERIHPSFRCSRHVLLPNRKHSG
jgi:hypothetical protein